MTISHRVTRNQSSNSSVRRENTISSHSEPDAVDEQTEAGHLRGSAELPPIIPNLQDRPLIEPDGKK